MWKREGVESLETGEESVALAQTVNSPAEGFYRNGEGITKLSILRATRIEKQAWARSVGEIELKGVRLFSLVAHDI